MRGTLPRFVAAVAGTLLLGSMGPSIAAAQGMDSDGDTIEDSLDNCPTIANTDQLDLDRDDVGDVCDNCVEHFNPALDSVPTGRATTGRQLDDDRDGVGNACDGDHTASGTVIGAGDTTRMLEALGRTLDEQTCPDVEGAPNASCSIYDLDGEGPRVDLFDLEIQALLTGTEAGSAKCALCPLECEGEGCAEPCTGEPFPSTYEAIHDRVFENPAYGCLPACHGRVVMSGGLRLQGAIASFFSLALPSNHPLASAFGFERRLQAGDHASSFLWAKLASKKPGGPGVPGSGMPPSLPAISDDHLEAIRLWIDSGAQFAEAVPGTEELLDACFPQL